MFTRRHFIVVTLGLTLAACGGSKKGSAPVPQPRTSIRIENQGFSDMTIYAIRSGQRVRLGNAPGNSTTTFTIPSNLIFGATPLRFLADPIGSNRTPVSDEITVQPGLGGVQLLSRTGVATQNGKTVGVYTFNTAQTLYDTRNVESNYRIQLSLRYSF